MGKKSKSRTQKGNLMFDTSLYDVVKNRPVGGVALRVGVDMIAIQLVILIPILLRQMFRS